MPKRIQMTRQRPWRAEHPDAVIVARPTKWGNPWTVQEWADWSRSRRDFSAEPAWFHDDVGRDLAVESFRSAVTDDREHQKPGWYPDAETIRAELRGRDLACWCPLDSPCHGDVLLELANGDVPCES